MHGTMNLKEGNMSSETQNKKLIFLPWLGGGLKIHDFIVIILNNTA
jgi:hypothetical protein